MTENEKALLDAVENKESKVVKALLAEGTDPKNISAYDENVLIRAMKRSSKGIVKALIPKSDMSETSKDGLSLIHTMAEYMPDVKIANLLIEAGAATEDVDDKERTPLFNAVKASKIDLAAALIAAGADINAKDKRKVTPLLHVLKSKSGVLSDKEVCMAKGLVELGADVKAQDDFGTGVLHLVAAEGDVALIDFMLDKGAPLFTNSKGATPLHYSIGTHGFEPELWQKLIDLGCSIEDKGHGDSALHSALSSHNVKAAKWFLEQGADIKATNSEGQSALEYANDLGNAKLIKLFSNL